MLSRQSIRKVPGKYRACKWLMWRPGLATEAALEATPPFHFGRRAAHALTRPCRRRRPRRQRGRLAARPARRAGRAARDAAGAGHRCAQDRPAGRAGLLELVPLRRRDGQRGGPAARGDAAAGLADHGDGRPAQAAGGRGAGGRSGRLRGRRSPRRWRQRAAGDAWCARRWRACRRRSGASPSSPPARSPRRRWPRTSAGSAARSSSPSSTRSRRSCIGESIDLEVAWFQSRYDKAGPGGGTADYINCPLDREQYDAFIDALLAARRAEFKDWETAHALFRGLPADRGDGRARAARPCASGR